MGSMIVSTYMSFLPRNTALFCAVVLCIGFFGIFLPYQERKKKKQQVKKHAPKPPEKPSPSVTPADKKQLDQLKALKTAGIISEEEYQKKKKELKQR